MTEPRSSTDGHVRILFRLEKDEEGYPPADVERLWARPREKDAFEIDNIPFFVRGISLGDVVAAQPVDGELEFSGLVLPSGNSTLRVIVFEEARVPLIRSQLRDRGCSTELHTVKLLGVDVPREVNLWAVREWLTDQERMGILEFEDASLRHPEPP